MRYRRFKGTAAEYRDLHHWVERRLGKPKVCSKCNSTDQTRYDWANISQEYKKDVNDWMRLCRMCHVRYDNGRATHCIRGHELTAENLYTFPKNRKSECRTCRAIRRKPYEKVKVIINKEF